MKSNQKIPPEIYLKCSVIEHLTYAKKDWLTVKLPNDQIITVARKFFVNEDEIIKNKTTERQGIRQ